MHSHCVGLYHKLHGVHRPVAMKKSIIKRRKRVVPAPQEHQSPNQHIQTSIITASPDVPNSEVPQSNEYQQSASANASNVLDLRYRESERPHPPPIDFTDYRIRPSHHQSNHYPARASPTPHLHQPPVHSPALQPHPVPNALKRTFSATDSDPDSSSYPQSHRLSSISSLLNHPQNQHLQPAQPPPEEIPIDPNLSLPLPSPEQTAGPCQDHGAQNQGMVGDERRASGGLRDDPGGEGKEEKRRRLMKEMENLSETMRAKRKELEDLG